MRKILGIAATAAIFAFPATALCQQPDQQQGEHAAQPPPPTALEEKKEAPRPAPAAAQGQSQSQSPTATSIPPNPPKESLAEAARRSREQRKDAGKSGKVFTNDNLPTEGVSTVGGKATAGGGEAPGGAAGAAKSAVGAEGAAPSDEKTWREPFGKLRDKLAKDQAEL